MLCDACGCVDAEKLAHNLPKVQGRFREGAGKVQVRCRECSGKVQGRFKEGAGKV